MDTEATQQVWGAPQSKPAHWSRNKSLAAVGIAAVLAGVGAAVIYATGDTTTIRAVTDDGANTATAISPGG